MSPKKSKAFSAALDCMPTQMNIQEMVIFFLGVCNAYGMEFEDIAELFLEVVADPWQDLTDAQPAAHMFQDEKLQALFASNPFDASPDVKR